MKKFILLCLCAFLLFAPLPDARAQNLGWGLGFGLGSWPGGDMPIIKIGSSARRTLKDYLVTQYQQHCPVKAKKLPDICTNTKPVYVGRRLGTEDAGPLPAHIVKKIGFIEPGTDYAQAGFVVYLISVPRRIILDEVNIYKKE